MIPSVVVNIVVLIVSILFGIVIIPICMVAFWDETKEYFIKYANPWYDLKTTDSTIMMTVLYVTLAIRIGLFSICIQ